MRHIREVLKIGTPLLAGALVEYVMYIADSVMVGRLGTEYLAAVAIGGIISEVLWAFTWTVAPAVQTFVSRRYGRQSTAGLTDRQAVRDHTAEAARTGIVFGLTAGTAALVFSIAARPVLKALVEDPQTVSLAMEYVTVLRWSMIPAAVFFALYGFLSGIGKTRVLMAATILTNVLNIFLNYLLIYGRLFFPALGIRGAALGTLISQCTGLMFLAVILVSNNTLRSYHVFRLTSSRVTFKSLYSGIFRAWLPVTLQNIGTFCFFLVYEGLVSRFGTVYLAVIHIVFLLTWAGKSVAGGLAQGGSILVGNHLGRSSKKEAVRYGYACLVIGGVTGLFLLTGCLAVPELVLKVFKPDAETLLIGVRALRFFAVFMFIGTFGYSLEVIFTFNGWGSYVLAVDLASHILFTLGFSWTAFLLFHAGISMVWWGYGLYLAAFAVLLFSGFVSMGWAKKSPEKS